MKNRAYFTLSLFLLLGTFNYGKCQKTHKIIFDWNQKTFTFNSEKQIKRGDFYQLEVQNINQNLFKISINSVDSNTQKPLVIPTFADLDIASLTNLVSNLSTGIVTASNNALKAIESAKKDGDNNIVDSNNDLEKVKKILEEEQAKLSLLKNELSELKNTWDNLLIDIYKYRILSKRINGLPSGEPEAPVIEYLKHIQALRQKASLELKTQTLTSNNYRTTIYKEHKAQIDSNFKAVDKAIRKFSTELIGKTTQLLEIIKPEKIDQLLTSLIHFENRQSTTFKSISFRYDKDVENLGIKIEPRETGQYNIFEEKFSYPLFKRNYTGVGPAFYISSLTDDFFSIQAKDTTYSITEEGSSEIEYGMSAMVRFGKVFEESGNFGGHFTFGPGVNISDKIRPRLLAGVGISLGGRHKLTLDAGCIIGQVERRRNAFEMDNGYLTPPENITISKTEVGKFGAIGYLFQF